MRTNRSLDLLGVPDLPTRAFTAEGGRIKPQGGSSGGGGGGNTTQTAYQTNIPEYARPYAEEMLGQGQALTDINQNPYQPFTGQRFSEFSPMQAQAFQNVSNQQVAPQLTDASNLAYTGAVQGLGAQGTASQLQNTALGYGAAGAGYGDAASMLGIAGAQQAQQAARRAQQQAAMYGAQGSQFGAAGATNAQQAQRAAEQQADIYGQMGAGFGTAGASMAPQAQQYGSTAAGMGVTGMGYGAQGADIGGIGVQQAQQGFGAGAQYAQQATDPSSVQAYMSPYMQNVVDVQSQEARRNADIQRQATQSQATQQGAFGGSRSAIMQAEADRNLATQLGRIQAEGSQNAFQNAQQSQQFGANLGLQGLQAGYQGLNTGLSGTAQGMQGAQTGISGQQAGLAGLQQAGNLYGLGMQGAGLGLQGTGQRLAAGQLGLQGTAQGISGSQAGLQGVGQQISGGQLGLSGAQTGIQGQQAGMQGAQAGLQGVGQATGAGQYGLAGSQLGVQGAGTLGQLGEQQYTQEMGITDAMQKYGALQQQQGQQQLDFDYQQFLAQQQYPYQQLSYMSDLLRGVPSSQSSMTATAPSPNSTAQLLGAGLSAYGAFGRAKGGTVKKYADGGQVSPDAMGAMDVRALPTQLRRLSDTQIAAYARSAKDAITLSAIQNEIQRRARARQPMGSMPEVNTAEGVAQRAEQASLMAGGGIVALQAGGRPNFEDLPLYQPEAVGSSLPDTPLSGLIKSGLSALPQGGVQKRIDPQTGKPISLGEYMRAQEQQATEAARVQAGNAQPPAPPANVPMGDAVTVTGAPKVEAPPAKASGTMGANTQAQPARTTSRFPSTFAEYQKQVAGAMDNVQTTPEDTAVITDMRNRLAQRMKGADDQGNDAKYDAIMMAGLAMMGGTSLADGIARAAQTGGATYMASKAGARKAMDAASDAQLAFDKYQMDLRRGDRESAAKQYDSFLKNATTLYGMDLDAQVGMARANADRADMGLRDIKIIEGLVNGDQRVKTAAKAVDEAPGEIRKAKAQANLERVRGEVAKEYNEKYKLAIPSIGTDAGGGKGKPPQKFDINGNAIQ